MVSYIYVYQSQWFQDVSPNFFHLRLSAGSNIIETCTYQASIPGFMKYLNLNLEESIQLIQEAVTLARQAIKEERQINPTIGNGKRHTALRRYRKCLQKNFLKLAATLTAFAVLTKFN